ncbi:carboxypeptidase D-like [Mytilus trossulus]|uniref:carboxypeptidase D-like n=1 Tax=Mytilus trossulus TaxID=6551 RepID=UPI0030072B79
MVSESQRWTRLAMNFFIVFVSLCHVTSSLDFQYHNYQDLTNYLKNMSNTYPDLTHLYSIGKTVQKRDLHVLAIGKLPQNHLTLRPHVKYVGNMHGNEAVGREMLLHLIDYYLTNYNVNSTIKTFLDNTVVHILPSMNPDGFEVSSEGDCIGVQGRPNTNNYDLNRNFPGYFEVNPRPIQPETQAVMDWLKQHRFILSANLHGGAMVANYPFDNYVNGSIIQATRYVRSPDDDTFIYLSKVYSYSHANMYTGKHCEDVFPDGITNGALWYPVLGGMQDYNYVREGCFEITLEIGCCKYPQTSLLPTFWTYNKDALINFLMAVHSGVKGLVRTPNNTEVAGYDMAVKGRQIMFKSSQYGEYWRLLRPGTHTIQVLSDGKVIAEKQVQVPASGVVREDIYIGDDTSSASVIQSCLPVVISLVSIYLHCLDILW